MYSCVNHVAVFPFHVVSTAGRKEKKKRLVWCKWSLVALMSTFIQATPPPPHTSFSSFNCVGCFTWLHLYSLSGCTSIHLQCSYSCADWCKKKKKCIKLFSFLFFFLSMLTVEYLTGNNITAHWHSEWLN